MTCSEVVVGRRIHVDHVVCNVIWQKRFFCGTVLVFVFHFGLFLMFGVICNRSTRPPGGDQVGGLPPALSWVENARNLFGSRDLAVVVLHQGCSSFILARVSCPGHCFGASYAVPRDFWKMLIFENFMKYSSW